ncbi:MAG: DNA polymerase III subunit chi [Alphaproteobacteria bacterium]|nr:DNA polymerase III subunit chi [Alphaproteobacteria bacterium]
MTEIRFYHLERSTLERALATMLERVLERGQRALVLLGSPERAEALNAHLWTYRPDSFLPHGTPADGFPEEQPILLAAEETAPAAPGPNKADVLFLADGARAADVTLYKMCVELFDGADDAAVRAARERWRAYKAAGHALTYWRQSDKGWQKEAEG